MSIEKVAKLAGVSNSTVSRVMNDNPRVSPETIRIVKEAMASLNYAPSLRRPGPKPANRTARTTRNIAFLVLGITRDDVTPAFETLLRGVSAAASELDASLSFAHVPDADELPARMRDPSVDGLLLHGTVPAVGAHLRDKPCVWLMGNRRRPEWGDQVMPDTYHIGEMAARHLLSRGHKQLAYLNLDAGHWSFTLARHAFEMAALSAGAGVTVLEQPRAESADYQPHHTAASASRLVDQLLAIEPRPTGLMIADDRQTAVLQPLLQRRGIEVRPGGVEIVSVNNEKPYLVGLDPTPTVLDLRFDAVGRRGVEQLLWRIDHGDVKERIVTAVEPMLITT